MRPRFSFSKLAVASLMVISIAFGVALGQANPRQEKLLNGLRVLMWSQPSASTVNVKMRIHAGASFDQQEKEGTMCMVAEALFPTNEAREFFTDDLGGSLRIECNYDYIEIIAASKPESYLTMLETIAGAVTTPTLDRQTTDAVRSRVLAIISANEKNAARAADLAVQKRLFGTFPYGRPVYGTAVSLQKIDFADLRFAYDRLFGADNATIAVSGNFPADVGYRAIRRYFGSWLKSDKKIPSTFKQPEPPQAGAQILESPENGISEIRYAVRGVARSDRDFAAAWVLSRILEQRIRSKAANSQTENVWVRNHSNVLPGTVIVGFSRIQRGMTAAVTSERPTAEADDIIASALKENISATEFAAAKGAVSAEINRLDVPSRWLDADTYRLASVRSDQFAFDSLSLADVQRVADRIKMLPVASVILLGQKTSD